MVEVVVLGAEQFAALARRVRAAGDKEFQRQLQAALTRATSAVRQRVKDELPAYLPNNYAEDLAPQLRMRTSGRSGRGAGIRITAKARGPRGERFVGPLNDGMLRHPLFGMRKHWYAQDVHPGFFSQPIEESAPEIRQELIGAMDVIAEQIAH